MKYFFKHFELKKMDEITPEWLGSHPHELLQADAIPDRRPEVQCLIDKGRAGRVWSATRGWASHGERRRRADEPEVSPLPALPVFLFSIIGSWQHFRRDPESIDSTLAERMAVSNDIRRILPEKIKIEIQENFKQKSI